MSEQSQQWLQEASTAVQEGRFEEALKLAEQSIEAEPTSEAWVIRGIALAQLARNEEATSAFREGIRLNPQNARAYYNLATHLYQLKELVEARAMASEALRIDPNNQSARNLIVLIDQEAGTAPAGATNWTQPPGQEANNYLAQEGAIPFVQKMGSTWTMIGIGLIVLSLVASIYTWSVQGPLIAEIFRNAENQAKIKEITDRAQEAQRNNPMTMVASIVGWVALLGTLLWGCLDIANLRKSWFWLIGFIPCSCCGFSFIILSVYMAIGRKGQNPQA